MAFLGMNETLGVYLLLGSAFSYISALLYGEDKRIEAAVASFILGFSVFFLNPVYTAIYSGLIFLAIVMIYSFNYTTIRLKHIKIGISIVAIMMLYFYPLTNSDGILKTILLFLCFLLLPARSHKLISVHNRYLSKTLHLLFRGLLIYLSPQIEIYSWYMGAFVTIVLAALLLSWFFHKNYNKNNEDLFISLFLFLIVLVGETSPILLFSYSLIVYLVEYYNDSIYAHNYELDRMFTWMSPVGIKTYASFLLLSFSEFGNYYVELLVYSILLVMIGYSTFRTKKVLIEDKIIFQPQLQRVFWLVLVLFGVGGHFVAGYTL
tara:strand:+ start:26654 stop:27613 length:960 start_codon:yes stop_codon:yes gene_type:complete